MSTYAGKDDCTDIILEFIADHEAAGNYNAVIGDSRAKDDLSDLTLAGIYKLQDRLVAMGRPSSAVGRYQILRKTLRGLQDQLKLPGSTKFAPETQDMLAVELLVGRGYEKWWRGDMSDEEFAHHLSREWASLPDPYKDGRSHYDGVGSNRAGTTLENVYLTLKEARAARKAVSPPAPIPEPKPAARVIDRDLLADAIRIAQREVGARPDGVLGPITIAAIQAAQRTK